MKKTALLNIIFLLIFSTPLYAQKPDTFNMYLSGKMGYSATFTEIKETATQKKRNDIFSSFNIGGAFGGQYYFLEPFGLRIEFEYLFRTKDETKRTVSIPSELGITTHTILTNTYLDWYIIPQVAIYTQAGVGVAITELDYNGTTTSSSSSYGGFVWQAGIGTWYAITKSMIIDFNIRYVGYSTKSIESIKMKSLSGLDTILSVRYLF